MSTNDMSGAPTLDMTDVEAGAAGFDVCRMASPLPRAETATAASEGACNLWPFGLGTVVGQTAWVGPELGMFTIRAAPDGYGADSGKRPSEAGSESERLNGPRCTLAFHGVEALNKVIVDLSGLRDNMVEVPNKNPTRWFYANNHEAEWWYHGGATRDEAIAAAKASYPGEAIWIGEARRMTPGFKVFDAEELRERLGEDECWGEDGWEGDPCSTEADAELESELSAVFERWFAKHCTLDGAQLDFIGQAEQVPA